MAVTVSRVTVTTTPVALNVAETGGVSLLIKNTGTSAVDLGPSGVTFGAGYELPANETVTIVTEPSDVLFAVSDATGATLMVLET